MAGNIFLVAGLLISAGSSTALLLNGNKKKGILNVLALWGPRLSATFTTIAIALLAYYFLKPDFNFQYIFDRSSISMPWIYRLSAMWAGQAGTFLMWGWVILLGALYISETKKAKKQFINRVIAVTMLGGAFFLFMTIQSDPFAPTMNRLVSEASQAGVAVDIVLEGYQGAGFYQPGRGFLNGMGLSPMLQTPYNALHPPLMFIGYGFVFIIFAASILYLINGTGNWEAVSRPWARLSWVFMTTAMVLGSLWAYEELAFGGYWTWDPIEAASILPWLTLTAYLHGSVAHRKHRKLGVITPLIGVFTTLLIIYSTYITRSGIIKSSHSYAGTSSAGYLILFVISLSLVTLYFTFKRISWKAFSGKFNLLSKSTLTQLSVIGLLGAAGVVFWGLTEPVAAKILKGMDVVTPPEFYNKNGFLPTVFVIFIAGIGAFLGHLKKSALIKASAATIILSVFFYAAAIPTSHAYVNVFIPFIVFTLGGLIYRTWRVWKDLKFSRAFYKQLSADIAHLGLVLVITGVVVSGALSTSHEMTFDFNRDRSRVLELGEGYSIRLDDVKVFQDTEGNWIQDGYVTLINRGNSMQVAVSRMINDAKYGHHHSPFIVRGITDVYGVFFGVGHQSGNVYAFFNFWIIPFVNLIWIGVTLLIAGMIGVLYLDNRGG